jgi:hypothetical protein
MKRYVRNEKRSGIAVVATRAEKQTATEGGWSCSSRPSVRQLIISHAA